MSSKQESKAKKQGAIKQASRKAIHDGQNSASCDAKAVSCEERIYGFEPFVPEGAKVLILGSMPSVKSLEQGFYYAHPQNRRFKLIARYLALYNHSLVEKAVPLGSVSDRKAALTTLGIAMWDTVDSCVRNGSLDSNIKVATYADIASLLKKHGSIRCVITAGGFAAKAFKKSTLSLEEVKTGKLVFDYHALPSTSPANTVSFEKLCESYDAVILPHLGIKVG